MIGQNVWYVLCVLQVKIYFHPELFLLCVQNVMKMLMTTQDGNDRAGVMIPIPQYPLYTATLAEYNAYPVRTEKHNEVLS